MRTFRLEDAGLRIGPLRIKTICPRPERAVPSEVAPDEALLLWTADWLAVRKPIAAEQQDLLLAELGERIRAAALRIEEQIERGEKALETIQLVILDSTLVAVSGMPNYLDLRTGDVIDGPRLLPIESLSCNLTGLYCMHRKRIDRHAASNSARNG